MVKNRQITGLLVLLGLLVIIVYQAVTNWQNYVKPWFDDNKGFMLVSSPQRSGILFMDPDRARFLRFLDAYLPKDATIVMPPGQSQSILQNFLFPRAILACCGSNDTLCQKCLSDTDYYILAVDSFPLPEDQPGRVFVAYPQATHSLRGVYVPQGIKDKLSLPDPNSYGKTKPISVKALLIDITAVLSLFALGGMILALLYVSPTWSDVLEFAIPLSIGFMSWTTFLASYFGAQINIQLVIVLFAGLFICSFVSYKLAYKKFPRFPKIKTAILHSEWKLVDGLFFLIVLIALAVFLVIAFLSVGRGYSTFDDIVNWSFKGYAMFDSGTIWAGGRWGGHVLAYPMNLPLSIGMFRLLDGDMIPGSKLLYVLLTFSLLCSCYRFLTRDYVNRIWAITGVLALLLVPMFLFHATIGFANLPFTVYLVLGILMSLEGLRAFNKSQILLGGILLALAGWTRPEGLFFGLVFIALIYVLVVLVLKSRQAVRQIYLSVLPVLIIPGSWVLLLGNKGMGEDQIGLALKALLRSVLHGNFKFEAIQTLLEYAYRTFYNLSFILLIFCVLVLIVTVPITRWYKDKFKLSLALLDILAFILPIFIFYVASFNEKNFVVFLDQSFDRAFLPALTITMLAAMLAITGDAPALNQALNTKNLT